MQTGQEFCDQHGPLVWQCAYRVLGNHADALDCCQEVLCELWQRGLKEADAPLVRWLATRRAIDALRRLKSRSNRAEPGGDLSLLSSPEPGPIDAANHTELLVSLRTAVAELPPKQAEAFWLRCIEELPYAEIAERLRVEPNAVGVLVHRARSRLRKRLSAGFGVETRRSEA